MDKPLADLLVLDLTRALAGPIAGRLLSDLGATVIKVEPPDGDLTRTTKPRQDAMAVYFVQANAGKRCVSVDLRSDEGRAVLLRMVERADILLENYRPEVMSRLGLGYEVLSGINPRLIMASVSGYGHGNVWSHRGAFAAAVQAETGITDDIAKRRGTVPRNDPVSQSDVYGGLHALAAVLAAVHHRHRTGVGQAVEVDMAEASLVANDMTAINLRPDNEVDDGFRSGSNWPPCYQLATGRWVTVTADPATDGAFRLWIRAMDRRELADDPRFVTMADRMANAAALDEIIGGWVAGFGTAADLEAAIGYSNVLVADVRTAAEIRDSEWAADRGAFVEVPVAPDGDPVTVPQSPWRFTAADGGAVPTVGFRGQHNREVLGQLFGFADEELDRLEADGIISDRLPAWMRENQPDPA
ncbi:MAG: CaiB/BaiF CoA-transferase family protein [Actinomycetota bacterium]